MCVNDLSLQRRVWSREDGEYEESHSVSRPRCLIFQVQERSGQWSPTVISLSLSPPFNDGRSWTGFRFLSRRALPLVCPNIYMQFTWTSLGCVSTSEHSSLRPGRACLTCLRWLQAKQNAVVCVCVCVYLYCYSFVRVLKYLTWHAHKIILSWCRPMHPTVYSLCCYVICMFHLFPMCWIVSLSLSFIPRAVQFCHMWVHLSDSDFAHARFY